MEFDLQGSEYIQLNQLLKVTGLVGTGGEAMVRIESEEVSLNGEICNVKRKKLFSGDVIEYNGQSVKIA